MKLEIILTLAALLFVGLSSLKAQKKSLEIKSTQEVMAPLVEVYEVLKSLEQFRNWSPFLVSDPNQKNYVTGHDGEIGSTFHWEGVEEKSKGHQSLAAIEANQYIRFECEMEKPFKGNPVFEYRLKKTDAGVHIVQDFSLKLSGFAYVMTKIFGVKKKMSANNQLGLERLKTYIEGKNSVGQTPDSSKSIHSISY